MKLVRTPLVGLALLGGLVWAAASVAQNPGAQPVPTPPPELLPAGQGNFVYRFPGADRSAEIAKKLAKATKEDEKKALSKELEDILSQQFDARLAQQKKELEDLEKQVTELKSVLQKRSDAKSAIVKRRFDQLLQDAEGLGWSAPGASQPRAGYGYGAKGVTGMSPFYQPATGATTKAVAPKRQ